MADGRGKRARKVVNYSAFSGGSDSDDDFKDDVILPTTKAKIQKPNKLKLKDTKCVSSLKPTEDTTQVIESTCISIPEKPHVKMEAAEIKENIQPNITQSSQEGDASVSDPDLDVHGLSSQETIVLSCESVKSTEQAEKEKIETVSSQDTSEFEHHSGSEESEWENGDSKKKKQTKMQQKRKVADNKDPKINKKPKIDTLKKEKNKNVVNVIKTLPPVNTVINQVTPNPINQTMTTKKTISNPDLTQNKNVHKSPVWNPPGKEKVCHSPVIGSSPTIGLRLGLSRHGRVKPLHRVANIKS